MLFKISERGNRTKSNFSVILQQFKNFLTRISLSIYFDIHWTIFILYYVREYELTVFLIHN